MFDTVTLDEPMLQLRSGIGGLSAEDRDHWSSAALTERLTDAVELRDRLDAEVLRLTGEWDRRRAWEADGALSAISWMTHRLPVSRTRAQDDVRTARFLERHDRVAKSVSVNDFSVDHARVLARVANDRRQHLFEDHVDALVDAAEVMPVGDFSKVVRRWGQLADDQLASADFMEQHNNRHLMISPTFQGAVHVDSLLDPEGGALFTQAIDIMSPPDPVGLPGGPRTAAQRRADALVEMSRIILQGAKGTGVSPTNLNAIVDVDKLSGDKPVPLAADARCDLDWSGPIGRETLRRMLCDCAVSRVVMRGRSEILDLGRKTRLVTSVQRRALALRDQGCVFPGCDRPESWCDAHHLRHWSETTVPPISTTLLSSADDTMFSSTREVGVSPGRRTEPSKQGRRTPDHRR